MVFEALGTEFLRYWELSFAKCDGFYIWSGQKCGSPEVVKQHGCTAGWCRAKLEVLTKRYAFKEREGPYENHISGRERVCKTMR